MSEARQLFMEVSLAAQKQSLDAVEALNTFRGPQGPKGAPGSIDNLTINGKKAVPVDGENRIDLTPSDVGALPSGGTAKDSEKLGGKAPEYYTNPRNLLDNSDFRNPIAQAGIGGKHGTEIYAVDRWKLTNASVTANDENGITLTTTSKWGMMAQKVNVKSGKIYTFAVKGNGSDTLIIMANSASNTIASIGFTNGLAVKSFSIAEDVVNFNIYVAFTDAGGTATLEWAALYEGTYTAETLPPYVPKGYAAELAECQRYYYQSEMLNSSTFFDGMVYFTCSSGYSNPTNIFFPVEMRVKPTISIYCDANKKNGVLRWDNDEVVEDIVPVYYTNKGFNVAFASGGAQIGKGYAFHYTANADL